jgi:hypothetical protein
MFMSSLLWFVALNCLGKTRYFRLVPGRLNYYRDGENLSDVARLGSIILPGATLAVFSSDVYPQHPYCFGITPAEGDRQYVLDCDSAAHRGQWIQALQGPIRQHLRAVPNSVREGWLTKQGGYIKSWKRRYAILTRSQMEYHVHFSELFDAQGSIPLSGGFLVGADDDESMCKEMGVASAESVDAAEAAAPAAGDARRSSAASDKPAASPSSRSSSSSVSAAPNSAQAQSNTPYGFLLKHTGSDRVYHFLTTTRSDRDGWIAALREVQRERETQE